MVFLIESKNLLKLKTLNFDKHNRSYVILRKTIGFNKYSRLFKVDIT